MRRRALLVALAIGAGCRGQSAKSGVVRVTVVGLDSTRTELTVPVTATRCTEGMGLLITGVSDRQGMLVWVATAGGADSGGFPLSAAGDSLLARHARASLRYLADERPHALALDSGTVLLARDGGVLRGTLTGSGLDPSAGHRPLVRAEIRGVPISADSEPCRAGATQ